MADVTEPDNFPVEELNPSYLNCLPKPLKDVLRFRILQTQMTTQNTTPTGTRKTIQTAALQEPQPLQAGQKRIMPDQKSRLFNRKNQVKEISYFILRIIVLKNRRKIFFVPDNFIIAKFGFILMNV